MFDKAREYMRVLEDCKKAALKNNDQTLADILDNRILNYKVAIAEVVLEYTQNKHDEPKSEAKPQISEVDIKKAAYEEVEGIDEDEEAIGVVSVQLPSKEVLYYMVRKEDADKIRIDDYVIYVYHQNVYVSKVLQFYHLETLAEDMIKNQFARPFDIETKVDILFVDVENQRYRTLLIPYNGEYSFGDILKYRDECGERHNAVVVNITKSRLRPGRCYPIVRK